MIMISTVIIILLAGTIVFWNAPFSIMPFYRIFRRRWRLILFIILLSYLFTAQTHTYVPVANLNSHKAKCTKTS
jgi:hypothetical protein